MTCQELAPLLDELLDGTLDTARAQGVRGHLRGCAACSQRLADLEALKLAASKLEPLEPPPSLWSKVAAQLEADQARAARRPRFWWWWQGQRARLAWGGAVLAVAALALVAWQTSGRRELPGVTFPLLAAAPAPLPVPRAEPVPDVLEVEQAAVQEIQDTERQYEKTAAELDGLVARERPRWKPEVARAFDGELARLEAAITGAHQRFAADTRDVRRLDDLIAAQRARNDYVQEALLHDGVGGGWL